MSVQADVEGLIPDVYVLPEVDISEGSLASLPHTHARLKPRRNGLKYRNIYQ